MGLYSFLPKINIASFGSWKSDFFNIMREDGFEVAPHILFCRPIRVINKEMRPKLLDVEVVRRITLAGNWSNRFMCYPDKIISKYVYTF